MPLYEYVCAKCNGQFELLVRLGDNAPACPDCGAKKLEKQLSVPAAHVASNGQLPVCEAARDGACGMGQCGMGGGCGMM